MNNNARQRQSRVAARNCTFLSLAILVGVVSLPSELQAKIEYYHQDALGSVRLVTDENGDVVSRHDYLPFGEEIPATEQFGRSDSDLKYDTDDSPPQRFTGKERDTESGLGYFGARYYSGAQGRFTSTDAPFADQHGLDPQSWNLYAYARNNPLRYTDPSGHCLRGYYETWESCGQYLLGVGKALGNIPNDTLNSPNRLLNLAISPVTDFQFPDLVPTPFVAANADQEMGMQGVDFALKVGTVLTAGEAAVAELAPGSAAATETTAAATKAPGTTRLGVRRTNPADWRQLRNLWDKTGYGDILSEANRKAIAAGRTPLVDEQWIKYFPGDEALMNEQIPMHHIGGTPITVPLPASRHLDAHMPGGFRRNPGGPGTSG